jgi:hypothetical protein
MRTSLLNPKFLVSIFMAATAVVFFPTAASAKCMSYYYFFVGKVTDLAGKPVDGARVYPFVDQLETAYAITNGQSGELLTDHRLTNKTGEYEVPVKLDSYSGSGIFGGESCGYVATSATLIIIKDGYHASRVTKKFRLNFKNGFDESIFMPTVSLRELEAPVP